MIFAFCMEGAGLEATWLVIASCERRKPLPEVFLSALPALQTPGHLRAEGVLAGITQSSRILGANALMKIKGEM